MTDKEEVLLEVMNSKELSEKAKLYIVQHLSDDTKTPVKTNDPQEPMADSNYLPDIQMGVSASDLSALDNFPLMYKTPRL